MTRYAENTGVSQDRLRAEIERTVLRYGADQFIYGWKNERAMVGFRLDGRRIKFVLPMPDRNDRIFTETETGRDRSESVAQAAWERAGRQRWRSLALAIKAKLVMVEDEITTIDEEFMAHIVMPDGKTIGEHIVPKIAPMYETGKMLPLLSTGTFQATENEGGV